jgi:hypothetical protein
MMSQPGMPTSTLSLTTYLEPGIYTFFLVEIDLQR